jgi:hypothetical protein
MQVQGTCTGRCILLLYNHKSMQPSHAMRIRASGSVWAEQATLAVRLSPTTAWALRCQLYDHLTSAADPTQTHLIIIRLDALASPLSARSTCARPPALFRRGFRLRLRIRAERRLVPCYCRSSTDSPPARGSRSARPRIRTCSLLLARHLRCYAGIPVVVLLRPGSPGIQQVVEVQVLEYPVPIVRLGARNRA